VIYIIDVRRFLLLRAKRGAGGGAEPPKKRAAPLWRSRRELPGSLEVAGSTLARVECLMDARLKRAVSHE
jgi:hypothetical protein